MWTVPTSSSAEFKVSFMAVFAPSKISTTT
jgi:hypothetical protein